MYGLAQAMQAGAFERFPCAQCGDVLVAPAWSEHVNEHCVRHLWSCDSCGYEFETSIRLRAQP
jgi:transcription elongation factor Elf1